MSDTETTTPAAPAQSEFPAPPEPWVITLRCGHWNTTGDPNKDVTWCEPCQSLQVIANAFDTGHDCSEHFPW